MIKKKISNSSLFVLIRIFFLVVIFSIVLLFSMLPTQNSHAATKLFVAGMPDGYPIEFYDKASKSYKGILPDSFEEISKEINVDIEYVKPSPSDNRLDMSREIQVDFICTYGLTDKDISNAGLKLGKELASFYKDGERTSVNLAYTRSMPENLAAELEDKLSKYWLDDVDSLLIEFASNEHRIISQNRINLIIIFSATILISIIALIVMISLFIHNRQIKKELLTDEITGFYSYRKWEIDYEKTVVPNKREHYFLLFLQTNMDMAMNLYSYEDMRAILTEIAGSIFPLVNSKNESFSRINQSNFIFYLQYNNIDDIKQKVKVIMRIISEKIINFDKNFSSQMSAGIYPLKISDGDIRKAIYYTEIAKENAHINSKDYVIYDKYIEEQTISKYSLGSEAVHGLFNNEFILYLQPIFSIDNEEIDGAEILVRWKHPTKGLLYPKDFMGTMKKQNLTYKMDMEIYRQGCKLLSQINQKYSRQLKFLFNFSSEDIKQDGFVDNIDAAAKQYDLNPENILIQLNQVIESTEDNELLSIVSTLRSLGFSVCLAELELDREFYRYLDKGINTVKIRHDLVKHVEEENGRKIIKNIINMCNDLNLMVLCVGVEKPTQVAILKELGCHFASGYHFCYPLDKNEFTKLLS